MTVRKIETLLLILVSLELSQSKFIILVYYTGYISLLYWFIILVLLVYYTGLLYWFYYFITLVYYTSLTALLKWFD